MKKIIKLGILTLFLYACKGTKSAYNSDCTLSKSKIVSVLSSQNLQAGKITINEYNLVKLDSCVAFNIALDKVRDIKHFYNIIQLLVLKIDNTIYTNGYYINGNIRNDIDTVAAKKYIDEAISKFHIKFSGKYNEEELDKIENYFRSGIIVRIIGNQR
ncbi:MAG: hypothetical protein K1X55_09340 [Chitinophagales bacterium]|nr:hypothetical protein [Chitinophagales bacterium]